MGFPCMDSPLFNGVRSLDPGFFWASRLSAGSLGPPHRSAIRARIPTSDTHWFAAFFFFSSSFFNLRRTLTIHGAITDSTLSRGCRSRQPACASSRSPLFVFDSHSFGVKNKRSEERRVGKDG